MVIQLLKRDPGTAFEGCPERLEDDWYGRFDVYHGVQPLEGDRFSA
jgi:hypothetical protein